ncbi:transcriptional regulator [Chitinophaga sp. MD30]|nr:transcriptional regulator [Chitinophaga sp. MD30]
MNRLAVVMKESRITNRALAAAIGYEEATVSKWVTNTVQPPLSTFFRIALVINRDLQDLFVSTKNITPEEKEELLQELEILAEQGKRTGKSKQKK